MPVTIDLVPPSPVTVTLTYNTGSGPQALEAGQTVTNAAPQLAILWTPQQRRRRSRSLLCGVVHQSRPVLADLTSYAAAGTHTETVNEPLVVPRHVIAVDPYGNRTTETVGPVYVDALQTPDTTSQPPLLLLAR